MKRNMLSLWLIAAIVFVACSSPPEIIPTANTATEPAVGGKGMVSTAHPLATQAGLDILEAGGNAYDAAVSVAAMLNVVEPMMSGIGGYGTILVYDAKGDKTWFLNSSGRIPAAVNSDLFRPPTPDYLDNRRGAKAVSTPGNSNAWASMSERYGSMAWQQLFEPAIRVAEEGFAIEDRAAYFIDLAFDTFPEHARVFYGKDGKPLVAGDLLVQKDLAQSLRLIAEQGAGVVHGGSLGEAIDSAMRQADGFLKLQDLRENQAEWWEPITINYRGYQVITASPPSTAFPSLVRLGLMSRFDVKELGHNSVEYLHLFSEATKHAFWSRLRYAGSPEAKPPPLDLLLSEAYWEEQVAQMDRNRATRFVPPEAFPEQASAHTTHFVVADNQGNIVSATQTLGNLFGSRIMPEGTGIWLNNSLAYCTFEPKGNPMDAHAGRHKLSGDCPTLILRDGKPWVALGTPGGHTIGQTVPQMVMNLIDFEMDIQQAIAAPRISFTEPDSIAIEPLLANVGIELAGRGHYIRQVRGLGNAHGLAIEYDGAGKPVRFTGGSDPRGYGLAQGY